jgi:hypothetical protein
MPHKGAYTRVHLTRVHTPASTSQGCIHPRPPHKGAYTRVQCKRGQFPSHAEKGLAARTLCERQELLTETLSSLRQRGTPSARTREQRAVTLNTLVQHKNTRVKGAGKRWSSAWGRNDWQTGDDHVTFKCMPVRITLGVLPRERSTRGRSRLHSLQSVRPEPPPRQRKRCKWRQRRR